jgi:hypothetical protein
VARIIAIVEGHGDQAAVPILLRRAALVVAPDAVFEVPRPVRVPRARLLRPDELERAVELAARQSGPDGGILILLDADDDCPAEMSQEILQRATTARPDRSIRVVLAKVEYEAWFLAAAESIAGRRGIAAGTTAPDAPESVSDAKGWITAHMAQGQSYRETLDQPALTAIFDLSAARNAPSFDKLWRDVASLLL